MMEFWMENGVENAVNRMIVEAVRMVNIGMLPTFQLSPSSPVMRSMTEFLTAGQRKGSAISAGCWKHTSTSPRSRPWGPRPGRPVLVLGAANVTSGALDKFVSSREAIKVEHILASRAVPSIFPAVQIGTDAYWDGLFSDNPPVEELIRPHSMGEENVPDEIWLIKINPTLPWSPRRACGGRRCCAVLRADLRNPL